MKSIEDQLRTWIFYQNPPLQSSQWEEIGKKAKSLKDGWKYTCSTDANLQLTTVLISPNNKTFVRSEEHDNAKSIKGILEKIFGERKSWGKDSQGKASQSLTCAAELEQDFLSQQQSSEISELQDFAKGTSFVEISSQKDSQELRSTQTCDRLTTEIWNGQQFSQLAPLVNHFQYKVIEEEPQMIGIASPQLSKRSPNCNQNTSSLKMSSGCLTAQNDQEVIASTSLASWSKFGKSGTMRNGCVSLADTLDLPGVESDYFWLDSPGALSTARGNRPPGLTRLESRLKSLGAIAQGECLNPTLLEDCFNLPPGWTDPLELSPATELIANAELHWGIASIGGVQRSPSNESSISNHVLGESVPPEQPLTARLGKDSNDLVSQKNFIDDKLIPPERLANVLVEDSSDSNQQEQQKQEQTIDVLGEPAITRPAARWYGGKWVLGKWIVSHFPSHQTYVEPFSGMWSVGLQKEQSEVEVYSDLHPDAVNFWLQLRDNPEKLIPLIESTFFNKQLREWMNTPGGTSIEQALKFYSRCLLSYTGGGVKWPGISSDRVNLKCPECQQHQHLWAIARRICNLQIFNKSAFHIIETFDSPTTLFYCDPCYLPTQRTSKRRYTYDMTIEQHEQLAELLNNVRSRVILSGYPSELYDHLYQGWQKVEKEASVNTAHKKTQECLWIKPNGLGAESNSVFSFSSNPSEQLTREQTANILVEKDGNSNPPEQRGREQIIDVLVEDVTKCELEACPPEHPPQPTPGPLREGSDGTGVGCRNGKNAVQLTLFPPAIADLKKEDPSELSKQWTTDCWRTPNNERSPILNLVDRVFGKIGLDPTADPQKRVPATKHFTKNDDCLIRDWYTEQGTVFMNPPFSDPLPFVQKLVDEIELGSVQKAIALLPSRCLHNKGTGQLIAKTAPCYLLWRSPRIAFLDANGKPAKNSDFDCCLVYWGDNPQLFRETFEAYGTIVFTASYLDSVLESLSKGTHKEIIDDIVPPEQRGQERTADVLEDIFTSTRTESSKPYHSVLLEDVLVESDPYPRTSTHSLQMQAEKSCHSVLPEDVLVEQEHSPLISNWMGGVVPVSIPEEQLKKQKEDSSVLLDNLQQVPQKKKRKPPKGQGSGYLEKRAANKQRKRPNVYYQYHYSFTNNEGKEISRSRYVPQSKVKQIEAMIQEGICYNDILEVLKVKRGRSGKIRGEINE